MRIKSMTDFHIFFNFPSNLIFSLFIIDSTMDINQSIPVCVSLAALGGAFEVSGIDQSSFFLMSIDKSKL